jgi:hypothetical protein
LYSSGDIAIPEIQRDFVWKGDCIPTNKNLWKTENYFEFIKARRKLLAKATNLYFKGLK